MTWWQVKLKYCKHTYESMGHKNYKQNKKTMFYRPPPYVLVVNIDTSKTNYTTFLLTFTLLLPFMVPSKTTCKRTFYQIAFFSKYAWRSNIAQWGHSTFWGECVPYKFPKVRSREHIFLEKKIRGLGNKNFENLSLES